VASEAGKETAADILAMAEDVMTRARPETAGLWTRAAALLARQALEESLGDFWRARGPALANCGTRPQLICLRDHLPAIGGRVYVAWAALTRACHHHAYELTPTVSETVQALGPVRVLGAYGARVAHHDTEA
jgi:hypothetical protein